jgi:hypothetical protein
MVSMMMSALFLSTTLQAYIAAASLRAKSQETHAAIASIQADAEALHKMAQVLPQSAGECQLPPSSSYAQRIMEQVVAQDTEKLNNIERRSPGWEVGSIAVLEQAQSIQQVTTLPIAELPDDYQFRRTLSIDLSGLATTTDTLQVSYTVRRLMNEIPPDGSAPNANYSQLPPVAQLHTSVMPNAALVCPS